MRTIDWYILKNFLKTFFFSVLLLTLISTVVDISEHTDDFVKSGLTAKQIFLTYYIGFIPHIIALLFPLFVFISVIFFTSKMANRSEFIPILSSGVSLNRLMRPYWLGGTILALLLLFSEAFIIPRANTIRTTFEVKYMPNLTVNTSNSGLYMRIDSFTYAGMRYYDTTAKIGGTFFLETVKNNQVVYNLRADNIAWDTTRKKWKLNGVVERELNGLNEKVNFKFEMYKRFSFEPNDLYFDRFTQTRMTTPELQTRIRKERLRGSETVKELEMENAHRVATPFSVLILTLIGALISFRRIRGGSGLHLAIGLIICAVYILFDRFSTIFSTKGDLNPYLAAWIPNLIFGYVAWRIYEKAPK
ncbi:MAG: YjgP/YjgQ family permease [Chitinophagia bacterium]|nr:YjgP/YjgQ family permease [Chitinophagia bacterium]